MRLLLDIDVLLDIALARPGLPASARVVARCGRQDEGYVAWHTVATLAYLLQRETSAAAARDFVRGLLGWADVAVAGRADALAALDLPMADFEDALQAAAASACKAQFVVTRNVRYFAKSPVPAIDPETYLRRVA